MSFQEPQARRRALRGRRQVLPPTAAHVRPFKWPEEDGDAHGFERGEALRRNSGTTVASLAKEHEPDEGAHGFERGESQMRKSWGTVARMARTAEARGP